MLIDQTKINILKDDAAILNNLHTLTKKFIPEKGYSDEILHGWPLSSEEPLADKVYEREHATIAEDKILLSSKWKKEIMESGGALEIWDKACIDIFGVEGEYIKKYCYIKELEYDIKSLLLRFHEKEVDSALDEAIEAAFVKKKKDDTRKLKKEVLKIMIVKAKNTTEILKAEQSTEPEFPYNKFWNNLSQKFFGIELFSIGFTELSKFKKEYDKLIELNKKFKQVPSNLLGALKLALGEKIKVQVSPRKSVYNERSLNLENKVIEVFLKLNNNDKKKFIDVVSKRVSSNSILLDRNNPSFKGTWGDFLKVATGFWTRMSIPSELKNVDVRIDDVFRIFWRILCFCGHYIDLKTKSCNLCKK